MYHIGENNRRDSLAIIVQSNKRENDESECRIREDKIKKKREEEKLIIENERKKKLEMDLLEKKRLYAPRNLHGKLIGKKGENIKKIRQKIGHVCTNTIYQ